MSENPREPELTPRDILQPIATLIGLLVAAIGFIKSSLPDPVFQGLIGVIAVMIGIFISTAALTTLYFTIHSRRIWRTALILYPVSWITFGTGVLFILIEVGYGPISLPNFPTISLSDILTFFLGFIAVLTARTIASLRNDRISKSFSELTAYLKGRTDKQKVEAESEAEKLVTPDMDYSLAFIKVSLDIEASVRAIATKYGIPSSKYTVEELQQQLFEKEIISQSELVPLMNTWKLRNEIVHGLDINDQLAKIVLEVALGLQKRLMEILARSDAKPKR